MQKAEEINLKERPSRCGECQFWQKTERLRFGESAGNCQRPYPAGMPYQPLENAPPLLLCDGVKRERKRDNFLDKRVQSC